MCSTDFFESNFVKNPINISSCKRNLNLFLELRTVTFYKSDIMVWSIKTEEEKVEDYGLWRPHWMGVGDRLLCFRYYGEFYLRKRVSEQLLELEVITDVFFHDFSTLSNRMQTSIFTIWSRGVWLSSTRRNKPHISPTHKLLAYSSEQYISW